MFATYPASYTDRFGEEQITIKNDGKFLRTVISGVEFVGSDFDSLRPVGDMAELPANTLTFNADSLCSCTFELDMPLPIWMDDTPITGSLHVRLVLGDPAPNGGIDKEYLELELKIANDVIRSRVRGYFEDALLDIQSKLPDGVYMLACINCAFSEYSPFGSGLFGSMACFRDNKEGYLQVKSKDDIFTIWPTMTEFVQETYLCPEFARRVPGTGYRG